MYLKNSLDPEFWCSQVRLQWRWKSVEICVAYSSPAMLAAWCLVHLKIIWRKINLFPQGYVLVHTAQPPPFKRFWKNICFGLELRRNYDTYNLSIGVHVVQHVINHYYTTISTNINTNMPHANVNMSNECSVSSYTQENCFSYMFWQ